MSRRAATALIALAVALLAAYVALWATQISPLRERGSDFSATYVAAGVLSDGLGARLYDQDLERQRHQAILPPGATFQLNYNNPPTAALLVEPLARLDPGTAFRIFSLLQTALVVAAGLVAAWAAPWPATAGRRERIAAGALAAAGPATVVLLLLGQWDGVNALGIALAYAAWRRGSPARAGAWLALTSLIAKPHLALGLAAFLAGRRRPRELIGAAAATLAVLGIWAGVTGIDGLHGFVTALTTQLGISPPSSTLGFTGLLTSWLGETSPVEAVAIGLSVAALGAAAVLGAVSRTDASRLEPALAGAVALSLLATPHLLAHDLTLMAPVAAWMLGRAATRDAAVRRGSPWLGRHSGRLLAGWLLLSVAVAADAGAGGVGAPGRLVPWVLIAAGVTALTATRGVVRRRPAAPA